MPTCCWNSRPEAPRPWVNKEAFLTRSLIVLPDDSAEPLLELIRRAKQSLRIKMFALSDPRILRALIGAHGRGVRIRIMLNPARRSGEIQNTGSRHVLRHAGIDVLDSNPAFEVTHEKSMVCDDAAALIGSANWEPDNFEKTRDYAIVTSDAAEVSEIIECFEADWSRRPFEPPKSSNLIWSPGKGRVQIAEFIDGAKHSLYIQNERYQDAIIVERLVRAKLRGVKVRVMTRPSHSLRADKLVEGVGDLRIMKDVGVGIRKIRHLRLHAKMLLADRSRAIVGSINLTPGSFDKRRELSIRVKDGEIVERLSDIVHDDWKNSRPLDLSDQGLQLDLEGHSEEDSQDSLARVGVIATDPATPASE
ncbi:MAG TPA: phospholipase D-like domain-containing protein [Bryobacteraceae bacterium]|nr:phospholipase D-like domain-containing protein [Bryobacteraceae bacterium]